MVTIRTEGTHCPSCGKFVDAMTPSHNEKALPKEGDIIIYLYCGAINTYTDKQTLKPITPERLEEFKKDSPDTYKEVMHISGVLKSMD